MKCSYLPGKILIIGGGAVVSEYYLPALRMLDWIDQTVVLDVSPEAVNNLCGIYPKITVHQLTFDQFIDTYNNLSDFAVAVVALPNWLHEEVTLKAISSGLHVLCEKPLALTYSACLRLAEHADLMKRILAVGMVRRLLPSVVATREALQKGLIGEIVSIDIEDGGPYAWLSNSGAFFRPKNGGILADMGVHYLDLVENLCGKLIPISYCDDYAGGVEANAEFHLKTDSGIPVRMKLSRTYTLRNTVKFCGQQGDLILKKESFDTCFWQLHRSELTGELQSMKPFTNPIWALSFESCFAEQFMQFIAAIQQNSGHYVSAREAAATIGLIEWAYQHRSFHHTIASVKSSVVKRPELPIAPSVVTGGTGFIGSTLVERLHEIGFRQISVPARNYSTCAEVARFPVSLPRVDLLDSHQVQKSISGARYVFHLAYGRDGEQGARITIEGTQNVVEAAIEAKAECVVVLSTMYVLGHPKTNSLVDETWAYAPTGGEYGKSKMKMEQWCLQRAKSSNHTRIVVLNPSCVYGPNGKTYTQLPFQMAREGTFCWIENGIGIANYTYIDNLIDAILLAAICDTAHGERFLINDGFCTWKEFLTPMLGTQTTALPSYTKDELIQRTHETKAGLQDLVRHLVQDMELIDIVNRLPILGTLKRNLFVHVPKLRFSLLKKRTRPSTNIALTAMSKPTYPPAWLADLFGLTVTKFSAQKAHKVLGWQPLISLEEGQERTTRWLQEIGLGE